MNIGAHISTEYYNIHLSDTIRYALSKMSDLHCKYLAVVENNTFYGLVDENLLIDQDDLERPVDQLQHLFKTIFLFDYQHIYDALQLMANQDLCFIPILDKNHIYLGCVTQHEVLKALQLILGNQESAILSIELGARDNALSHIAYIIESENAFIYSTAIHQIPDSTKLEMTIKINKNNLSAVISSLRRNNYLVTATYGETNISSDIDDRYQLFMNYLDM